MRRLFHAELSQHQGLLSLLYFLSCPVKSSSTSSDQLAETLLDEDISVLGRVCRQSALLDFSNNLLKDWKGRKEKVMTEGWVLIILVTSHLNYTFFHVNLTLSI